MLRILLYRAQVLNRDSNSYGGTSPHTQFHNSDCKRTPANQFITTDDFEQIDVRPITHPVQMKKAGHFCPSLFHLTTHLMALAWTPPQSANWHIPPGMAEEIPESV